MSPTSPSRYRHHPVELLKERAAELETINEQLRTEIAERKRVEEALRESEKRLRDVLKNSLDMVYWLDLETGTYDYVSPASTKVIGYSPEELIALGVERARSLAHPDDIQRLDDNVIQLLTQVSEEWTRLGIEYRLNHKELGYRWVSDNRSVVRDEGGRPLAVVGSLRDITERKRAEEALRASEGKLRLMFESVTDGIVLTDLNAVITDANEGALRIGGFESKSDLVGINAIETIASRDRERALADMEQLIEQGSVGTEEYTLTRADGSEYPAEISAGVLKDNVGNVVGFVSIIRDITERKRVEEALLQSEGKLSSFLDSATDGFMLFNSELNLIRINKAALRMLGVTESDVIGKNLLRIAPDAKGKGRYGKYMEVLRMGKPLFMDDVVPHPKFRHRHIAVKAFKVDGGLGIIGTDITERKRAEKALQESEERYRSLITNTNDFVYSCDVEGNIIFSNPSARNFTGCEPEETTGHNFGEYVHPDDARAMAASVQQVLRGEPLKSIAGVGPDMEFRMIKKDGEVIWATAKSLPIRDSQGEIIGFSGIIRDITKRKEAERQTFQQSAVLDAINKVFRETLTCETDEEVARVCLSVAEGLTGSKFGLIGEVNQAGRVDAIALSDPGWDACEMPKLGAAVMLKDMEIRGIWGRVLKDRQSLIVNDPASHPDRVGTPKGHPHITAFLGVPLNWAGKTIGVIALANKKSGYNLTDQEAIEDLSVAFVEALKRKRAEEEIKASLKEKEVLLKEVHHRVKNNLQVVSSLLYLQSEHIKDKHCLATIKESENRVRSMALVHEQLYQSEGLARVDFAEYIRNLATYLLRSHGVKPDAMTLKIDAEDVSLGIDTAIPCSLIISELISNSLEHAFPVGKAGGDQESEIRIDLHAYDNKLTLIVSDNGVGLPGDFDFRNTESFGLHLVNTLVSQLEGTIELDRSGGTAFQITFAEK